MSVNNQQPDSTYILAAREWNDAQQKVMESFQASQAASGESWLYLAYTIATVILLLAVYFLIRRKRR